MTRSGQILRALATIAISVLICGSWALAGDRVVKVYNWSGYIDPDVLTAFEKETGIKVVYNVFPGDEEASTILFAGKSGYDVVFPGAPYLQHEIKAGAFAKLDKSKLKNLGNLWDEVQKRRDIYDPGAQYSVPYMWGTTGIGINVKKVKERLGDTPLDSWDIVLKPENAAKLKDCGFYFLNDPIYVLPSILNYIDRNPKSHDPADIEEAIAVLQRVRDSINLFPTDATAIAGALSSGDICVAVGYSTDLLTAKAEAKEGVEIRYIIPKEGTVVWYDGMAIPFDAPDKDEAYIFIDFMQRPDIAAKNSNFLQIANGNKASQALIDKTVLENPLIYPPPEVMEKLFISTIPEDKTRQAFITRSWTKLKTGH